MNYTVKRHAVNLAKMLEMLKSPGGNERCIQGCCPAAEPDNTGRCFSYNYAYPNDEKWRSRCKICMEFINVPHKEGSEYKCPCWEFGSKKAFNKSQEALEKYYKEEA